MDWTADLELTAEELLLLKLCKKQKLWGFLRKYRHRILDEEVRSAIRSMYPALRGPGRPPKAPERLALALLLQVAFEVPDHEVPTLTAVDRRWQMVLGCLGATEPVLAQASVFDFRERARAHGLMPLMLEKTVDLARETKGFSHKRLRAVFDSSPLLGAGRVEDTFNLLGRAISQLVEVAVSEAGVDREAVVEELRLTVASGPSVKAVLDVDWRKPAARSTALRELLAQFERVRQWLLETFDAAALEQPPLSDRLATVARIIEQDTEPDPDAPGPGGRRMRVGGAKDRLISLSDRDMRHGRKSKKKVFSGYKRHVAVDADIRGLVCATVVQPANHREHAAAAPLVEKLRAQGFVLSEAHIDRGYLAASVVTEMRSEGVEVVSKPPTEARRDYFPKSAFAMDFESETITCPAGATTRLRLGKTVAFPIGACRSCELKSNCTRSRQRQLAVHPQERWYREMAEELSTAEGRHLRRQRVYVEHALARVGSIQGRRARFRGLDKNQFDLDRTAVVANCYVLGRLWTNAA
ncbi:MAG: transposase [Gemmatimonadota bacterium]